MKLLKVTGLGFALLLAASALFAQAGALGGPGPAPGGGPYIVRFMSNIAGAPVYINGTYTNTMNFTTRLAAGSYNVRVTAPGQPDWNQQIYVNRDMTIRADFGGGGGNGQQGGYQNQPQSYNLMINANINGAMIFIDGAQINVGTPARVALAPGRHSIRVTANGYGEWRRDIDLNGDSSVTAYLQQQSYSLRVRSNVEGAQVTIGGTGGGQLAGGRTPFEATVPQGIYVVTVSAPGYLAFTTTVTVSRNEVVQAVLQAGNATLQLVIPDQNRNPYVNDSYAKIEWYVDGHRVDRNNRASIEVDPGVHSIRIVSGGLSVEGRYNFQAGQNYRLDPRLQLNISQ